MRFVSIALTALILSSCSVRPSSSCDFTNCAGCCDAQGACQSGSTQMACGLNGLACNACQLDEVCSFGLCAQSAGTGGGTAGGGSGGGTAGGGSGGGTAGGGSGGGAAGGGAAGGGAAGGGAAGGGSGGGAAGGGNTGGGGGTACAGTLRACADRCVDFNADPENCGRCGQVCGQGQVCSNGQCGLLPVDCTVTQGCGAGFFCDPVSKNCLAGCRLTTDCPQGATCTNGTCGCPSAQHACGQACVSSTTTASCGARCSPCPQPAHSSASCNTGTCAFTCDPGYREVGGACVDVDECATSNGGCSLDAVCANTPGSRTCTCQPGFTGDGLTCTDVNECLANNGGCNTNATCTNTAGSRGCACNSGFTGDGLACADVNECLTNNGGCASTGGVCTNTPGSRTCACATGFTGNGVTCADVNECLTNNGGCASTGGVCTNTPGSRTCACATGFTGNGLTCTDVDECLTNNGGCATTSGGLCTNTPGSRTCSCITGYSGNGLTCADVNECLTNNGGCASTGGLCTNTPGSRTCACAAGFTGNGLTCADVDECLSNYGGCAASSAGGVCTNTPGSRTCTCASGYAGNGSSCADVNECLTNNGGCASTGGICTNTIGSRTCACSPGFDGTGVTCMPNGDVCNGAIDLASSTGQTGFTPFLNLDFTGSLSALCGGGVLTGADMVFRFTAPAYGTYRVSVSVPGLDWTPRVWVSPTCGSTSSCIASDPANSSSTRPFTFYAAVNQTLFVHVGSATTQGGGFTVRIDPVADVPGDSCAIPNSLSLGTPATVNITNATQDLNACGTTDHSPDVFFRFTPSTSGVYSFTETSSTRVNLWLASSCAFSSCLAQTTSVEALTATLTAGNTYFLMLEPAQAGLSASVTVVASAVSVPFNDSCAAPTELAVSTTVSGTTIGATDDYASALSNLCGGASTTGPDVVYRFVPASTGTYRVTTTSSGNASVWAGPSCGVPSICATRSPVSFGADWPFAFRGSAGVPVFLHVDVADAPGFPFTIRVDPALAADGDLCANAVPLTLGTAATSYAINAVQDLIACFPTRYNGEVFFSFTPATTGSYTFSENSGVAVDLALATSCSFSSCFAGSNGSSRLTATLTAGTTYYLMDAFRASGASATTRITVTSP